MDSLHPDWGSQSPNMAPNGPFSQDCRVLAQAGLGMLMGWQESGGRAVLTRHPRLGRSRKWPRTLILTRFPNLGLGSGRAVGRAYMAIGPHELLSWPSCSDRHPRGMRASTTVGGFSMNTSALPGRGRLSRQVPHLQRSFREPHPSRQEGKTGSPNQAVTVKPACHSVTCTSLALVMDRRLH